MKKQIFLATVLAFGAFFITEAQEYLSIEMNDNTVHEFRVASIKEVKIRVSGEDPNYPIADAIDLGLPSGTKWASWNVGATKPEEYGGYYAWGETEDKDVYNWSTYKYGRDWNDCDHIGYDIAGTEYDAAHVKWGGSWSMPTVDQIKELIDNCSKIWTSKNGVKGILITGPNGASIFLPTPGRRNGDSLNGEGWSGYYWSSSLYLNREGFAYSLVFGSSDWYWSSFYERYDGRSVRPVCP